LTIARSWNSGESLEGAANIGAVHALGGCQLSARNSVIIDNWKLTTKKIQLFLTEATKV
jgi:hypothetical protein